MGALRTKMIDEMRLRNFSPRTEQSYVSAMVGLVKYYRQSPDQLTQEQIRSYLLHLKERGLSEPVNEMRHPPLEDYCGSKGQVFTFAVLRCRGG